MTKHGLPQLSAAMSVADHGVIDPDADGLKPSPSVALAGAMCGSYLTVLDSSRRRTTQLYAKYQPPSIMPGIESTPGYTTEEMGNTPEKPRRGEGGGRLLEAS